MQQNNRRSVDGTRLNVSDVQHASVDLLQGRKGTCSLGLDQLDGCVEHKPRIGNLNRH